MIKYYQLTGILNKSQFGQRLDLALAKLFPKYSRSQIKIWILKGLVKLNNKVKLIPKEKIYGNENVHIQIIIEKKISYKSQNIFLNIVFEDEYIIIINKPCNIVVHPGAGNNDNTILNALLHYFPPISQVPRAGIVHRLDKNTTGLMVIAKTILAYIRLVELLKKRKIKREYEAIVIGNIISGNTINQPIARHKYNRIKMAVNPMGKIAITHYRILEHFRAHTRLRICLDTGRTHQIRVHMAYINHHLLGDPLYGKKFQFLKDSSEYCNKILHSFNRQALHAILLCFYHPITLVKMEWYIPLPQDMINLIAVLRDDFLTYKVKNL
ncbi:Ribosomal large subunit pseudouridine synthase D [Candidatus Mikella endobia]|uniref:Pseudouridine synthase n=1 Tax=Candidatus Mikella endobia TaxID=1778264 RepID=A0A143WQF4_9ENTR|nr:23S rRNA pseudouridine(1911/1915/1917) synthase RluD [Candidatus Mikella endobia]CUX95851.1 Ribosomal large subunit pseudouridine synthase D [Candidatus Mikella endobia]